MCLGRVVTGHRDANTAKVGRNDIPKLLARFSFMNLKHYFVEPLHLGVLQTGNTSYKNPVAQTLSCKLTKGQLIVTHRHE